MARNFDLIVLGTGAGGATVASKCRAAGWSVAIVDSRPYGGTCALRGCDPKKVLVGAADVVDAARRLDGSGVIEPPQVAWPQLVRFKRTFTEPVPEQRARRLTEAGITTLRGEARFTGPTTIEVSGEQLEGRRVHIATGAKPAPLPIDGAEHLTTSDTFLDLGELPPRLVFLGSGYIAFELAHVAATAGAQVTMLEMLNRPLSGFDHDLVSILVERTRSMGIELRLETRVEAIARRGAELIVRASKNGLKVQLEADMVVHSAGRVPDVDTLDLDKAGVEHDKGGVLVNEYMQSVSNPAVYAAGDAATGGLPLTPVASFEAHVAAANLLEGNHRQIVYPPIPSVVFTLPPLASVGLTEEEARANGLTFEVKHEKTPGWYTARRVGEEASGYKVLVEESTGKILGAHLIGPHAEEVINVFTMAMRCGITSRDIKKTIFAYPTGSSDLPHMV